MRKQNTKVHVYSVFAEIIIIKKKKTKGTCIILHSVSIDNKRIGHKTRLFMNTLILIESSFPNAKKNNQPNKQKSPIILSLIHLLSHITTVQKA